MSKEPAQRSADDRGSQHSSLGYRTPKEFAAAQAAGLYGDELGKRIFRDASRFGRTTA